jgi:hypothetical protein
MNTVELSEEQRRIVQLPAQSRIIVSAGPGTGKTHVLVHRVKALLQQGLSASEILVLSFSRAAIGEVEERLKAVDGDSAFVRVRTLDSLASSLLLRRRPAVTSTGTSDETGVLQMSFHERIAEVVKFLLEDPQAAANILRFRHIIVDEIQDVVGFRAELAVALLGINVPGFTLLGDKAQGIYDFYLTEEEHLLSIPSFIELVRQEFGDSVETFTLQKNFRTKEPNWKLTDLGLELCKEKPNFELLVESLQGAVEKLISVGTIDSLARMLRNPGSHAVLCTTKGDALYLSREFHERGVVHVVRGDSKERHWSRFILTALRSMPMGSLSLQKFATAYPEDLTRHWLPAEAAWKELRRIAGSRERYLNVADVVRGMRSGWTPDGPLHRSNAKVIVSTVHRAKGLEFGTVYLYEVPNSYGTASERARVAFVALTRSRGKTFRIPKQKWPFITSRTLDGRWRVPYPHSQYATRELEILSSDSADDLYPPGGEFGLAVETQHYIENSVEPNDPIILRQAAARQADSRFDYELVHRDHVVGLVSGVGIDLGLQRNAAGSKDYGMPEAVEGLFVNSIETVAGLPGASQQCGLGNLDVWLRVVVAGLGILVWPKREKRN